MHISAYVPDGLWSAACAAYPTERPSSIARHAVESVIEAHADGPIRLDAEQLRITQAAIDRFSGDAARWAALGYRAGLQLAQSLEWWALDQIANEIVTGRIVPPPIRRIALGGAPAALNGHFDGKTIIVL